MKWAYCTDLTTGNVDTELLGKFSMVGGLLSLLPITIGTAIAAPLMKLLGSPIKLYRLLVLVEAIFCGLLFLAQITGILRTSAVVYFVLLAIPTLALGIMFIPGITLNMECMDYEIYMHGKDRSALCNACNVF